MSDIINISQTPAVLEPKVPEEVTPAQIRIALTDFSLRANVEAAVAASDQSTKDWYEFANTFRRNDPYVLTMGAALGVSSAQLDALWTHAATIGTV